MLYGCREHAQEELTQPVCCRFVYVWQSFDRWARDLETGDYSFIKNKYARMWAETTWAAFSTIAGTGEQELHTRASYAQQLLAEYQQEGAAGYMDE